MAGRISAAMERALELVKKSKNVSAVAEEAGVDLRSLRRAMRNAGMQPRKPGGPPGPRPERQAQ